jgi:hypothetical protein
VHVKWVFPPNITESKLLRAKYHLDVRYRLQPMFKL